MYKKFTKYILLLAIGLNYDWIQSADAYHEQKPTQTEETNKKAKGEEKKEGFIKRAHRALTELFTRENKPEAIQPITNKLSTPSDIPPTTFKGKDGKFDLQKFDEKAKTLKAQLEKEKRDKEINLRRRFEPSVKDSFTNVIPEKLKEWSPAELVLNLEMVVPKFGIKNQEFREIINKILPNITPAQAKEILDWHDAKEFLLSRLSDEQKEQLDVIAHIDTYKKMDASKLVKALQNLSSVKADTLIDQLIKNVSLTPETAEIILKDQSLMTKKLTADKKQQLEIIATIDTYKEMSASVLVTKLQKLSPVNLGISIDQLIKSGILTPDAADLILANKSFIETLTAEQKEKLTAIDNMRNYEGKSPSDLVETLNRLSPIKVDTVINQLAKTNKLTSDEAEAILEYSEKNVNSSTSRLNLESIQALEKALSSKYMENITSDMLLHLFKITVNEFKNSALVLTEQQVQAIPPQVLVKALTTLFTDTQNSIYKEIRNTTLTRISQNLTAAQAEAIFTAMKQNSTFMDRVIGSDIYLDNYAIILSKINPSKEDISQLFKELITSRHGALSEFSTIDYFLLRQAEKRPNFFEKIINSNFDGLSSSQATQIIENEKLMEKIKTVNPNATTLLEEIENSTSKA